MGRITFERMLIGNLEQKIPKEDRMTYMTREDAYETLKECTCQDFGYDTQAWEKWFRENKPEDAWQGQRKLRENEDDWESSAPLGM